jgi:putative phosphotransacetylase
MTIAATPLTGRPTSRTSGAALAGEIARRVIERVTDPRRVVVGVSNRHVHLSADDLRTLFGREAFTPRHPVRQPGEFAADEQVTVYGPKGSFRLRCMGPCRALSQVELSRTDCIGLGIDAPVTESGHLGAAAPIDIEGPCGRIHLDHGAMVAARHLHCGTDWASSLGLTDQQRIAVAVTGERGGILTDVIVRTKTEWVPEVHLDTDEANALGLHTGDVVRLIGVGAPFPTPRPSRWNR